MHMRKLIYFTCQLVICTKFSEIRFNNDNLYCKKITFVEFISKFILKSYY